MRLVLAAALFLTATPVMAAPPETIAPQTVISALTGDWNNDGSQDRAVLIDNGDTDADLAVYLSDGSGGLKLAGFAPALAFNGKMFGNTPELQLSKTGALQVHSGNSAIGRDHWDRVLTLSYRSGQFMVSGITASYYDTLDPKAGGSCDINLLTGKGKAGKKSVAVKAGGVALTQWTEDKIPAACN
jgi:hypothetical protein